MKNILSITTGLIIALALLFAAPTIHAEDVQPDRAGKLLSGYTVSASTTANPGTNIAFGTAWFRPPDNKTVTLGLRCGSASGANVSGTVNWTFTPSNDGVNLDTTHTFVVGQTLSSASTNRVTTNMTYAVLGGARYWCAQAVANGIASDMKVSANVNWND